MFHVHRCTNAIGITNNLFELTERVQKFEVDAIPVIQLVIEWHTALKNFLNFKEYWNLKHLRFYLSGRDHTEKNQLVKRKQEITFPIVYRNAVCHFNDNRGNECYNSTLNNFILKYLGKKKTYFEM